MFLHSCCNKHVCLVLQDKFRKKLCSLTAFQGLSIHSVLRRQLFAFLHYVFLSQVISVPSVDPTTNSCLHPVIPRLMRVNTVCGRTSSLSLRPFHFISLD